MWDHRAVGNDPEPVDIGWGSGRWREGQPTVVATVEGVIWGTLAVLVLAVLVLLAGVYGLAELRIWWARQTGRGSC